jgi:predicted transcriptional regulator
LDSLRCDESTLANIGRKLVAPEYSSLLEKILNKLTSKHRIGRIYNSKAHYYIKRENYEKAFEIANSDEVGNYKSRILSDIVIKFIAESKIDEAKKIVSSNSHLENEIINGKFAEYYAVNNDYNKALYYLAKMNNPEIKSTWVRKTYQNFLKSDYFIQDSLSTQRISQRDSLLGRFSFQYVLCCDIGTAYSVASKISKEKMKKKCLFNNFYKAYDYSLFFNEESRKFVKTIEDAELKKYLVVEVIKKLINNDRIKSAENLIDIIEDEKIKDEALKYFD